MELEHNDIYEFMNNWHECKQMKPLVRKSGRLELPTKLMILSGLISLMHL